MKKTALPTQEKFFEPGKPNRIANLKRNWYFPVSAMAFFFLSAALTFEYFAGLLLAVIASTVISSKISSIWTYAQKNHIALHIISILTAIGVCWNAKYLFYAIWRGSSEVQAFEAKLPVSLDLPAVVSTVCAASALFFVYFCTLIFWKEMIRIFRENHVFHEITPLEYLVYSILLIIFIFFMIAVFLKTDAFYSKGHIYNIIYTSDSPFLISRNVYLNLIHTQNDLRQPLFAVFASPFAGIPYLLVRLFKLHPNSLITQAIFTNIIQIILLLTANFMLTRMMKLNSTKRICFMVLTYCTYTSLLFTLMMEQYIVAYFWLIFCMYLISEKQRPDRIALWGAAGTLLTSMILLPFMSEKSPIKNFKEWFLDMVKYGLEFAALMLAFCRFDIIFNLKAQILSFTSFTGQNITMPNKICQYTAFIHNCFAAPNAGTVSVENASVSWQLNPITSLDIMGIIIFLLAIISAILNRDKISSRFAAGWVGYSTVILLLLGWGTRENGLILYSLYFAWAFLVLLFQLVEKIQDKLNVTFLLPVISIGLAIVLAVINIPSIRKMIDFAIAYFPV